MCLKTNFFFFFKRTIDCSIQAQIVRKFDSATARSSDKHDNPRARRRKRRMMSSVIFAHLYCHHFFFFFFCLTNRTTTSKRMKKWMQNTEMHRKVAKKWFHLIASLYSGKGEPFIICERLIRTLFAYHQHFFSFIVLVFRFRHRYHGELLPGQTVSSHPVFSFFKDDHLSPVRFDRKVSPHQVVATLNNTNGVAQDADLTVRSAWTTFFLIHLYLIRKKMKKEKRKSDFIQSMKQKTCSGRSTFHD